MTAGSAFEMCRILRGGCVDDLTAGVCPPTTCVLRVSRLFHKLLRLLV